MVVVLVLALLLLVNVVFNQMQTIMLKLEQAYLLHVNQNSVIYLKLNVLMWYLAALNKNAISQNLHINQLDAVVTVHEN